MPLAGYPLQRPQQGLLHSRTVSEKKQKTRRISPRRQPAARRSGKAPQLQEHRYKQSADGEIQAPVVPRKDGLQRIILPPGGRYPAAASGYPARFRYGNDRCAPPGHIGAVGPPAPPETKNVRMRRAVQGIMAEEPFNIALHPPALPALRIQDLPEQLK